MLPGVWLRSRFASASSYARAASGWYLDSSTTPREASPPAKTMPIPAPRPMFAPSPSTISPKATAVSGSITVIEPTTISAGPEAYACWIAQAPIA